MNENNQLQDYFQGHTHPQSEPAQTQGAPEHPEEHAGADPGAHRWLTVDEAFAYLAGKGVIRSRKTIRKRCLNLGFPTARKEVIPNGHRWLIAESDLEQYAAAAKSYSASLLENEAVAQTTAHPQSEPAQTQGAPEHPEEHAGADPSAQQLEELEALKKELLDAKISASAANQARDFAMKQIKEMRAEMSDTIYRLGSAETQLKSLGEGIPNRFVDSQPEERASDVQ